MSKTEIDPFSRSEATAWSAPWEGENIFENFAQILRQNVADTRGLTGFRLEDDFSISFETQGGNDANSQSKAKAVEELQRRFVNEPQKLASILTELEQLPERLESTDDSTLRLLPLALQARYEHIAALARNGFTAGAIETAIRRDIAVKDGAIDMSGLYEDDFTPAKFKEEKNWLYEHRWKQPDGKPAVSPRASMEALRTAELWQVQSSKDTASDTTLLTITSNGAKIENWLVQRSADGKARIRPTEAPDPSPDNEGLSQSREALFDAILRSPLLKEDEQLEMIRDLTQLEHRCRIGHVMSAPGGTRAELAATYAQITKLLTSPGDNVLPAENRVAAARQLARELGDPGSIDQGSSSDACRIACAQYRLAWRRPSVVAKVVTDALVDSKINLAGVSLPFDNQNRKPASPQAVKFPRPTNERSFASQVFQLAAMNSLGQVPQVVREHIAYTNRWNIAGRSEAPEDTVQLKFVQKHETHETHEDINGVIQRQVRERKPGDPHPNLLNNGMTVTAVKADGTTVDLTCTDPGKERKDGGNHILLQAYASQTVLDLFDPGRHSECVFAHEAMVAYTRDAGIVPVSPGADISKLFSFKDEADLRNKVIEAKQKGNLPIIIASRDYSMAAAYHERSTSLREDMEETLAECDNTHIMIIRDYVPRDDSKGIPEHLVTDDFFGKAYDRRILPIEEWSRYFMKTPDTAPIKTLPRR